MVYVILLFILHSLDSFLNRTPTSSGPRREHQCLSKTCIDGWKQLWWGYLRKAHFPLLDVLFEGLAEGGQGKRMREKERSICIQYCLLLEIYTQTSLTFAIKNILSKGTKPDTTVVKVHRPWGPGAESDYSLDMKTLVATTQLTLSGRSKHYSGLEGFIIKVSIVYIFPKIIQRQNLLKDCMSERDPTKISKLPSQNVLV